jgi:hypothetical protein
MCILCTHTYIRGRIEATEQGHFFCVCHTHKSRGDSCEGGEADRRSVWGWKSREEERKAGKGGGTKGENKAFGLPLVFLGLSLVFLGLPLVFPRAASVIQFLLIRIKENPSCCPPSPGGGCLLLLLLFLLLLQRRLYRNPMACAYVRDVHSSLQNRVLV